MWHNKKKNPFAMPSAEPPAQNPTLAIDHPIMQTTAKLPGLPSLELPDDETPYSPRQPRFARIKGLLTK